MSKLTAGQRFQQIKTSCTSLTEFREAFFQWQREPHSGAQKVLKSLFNAHYQRHVSALVNLAEESDEGAEVIMNALSEPFAMAAASELEESITSPGGWEISCAVYEEWFKKNDIEFDDQREAHTEYKTTKQVDLDDLSDELHDALMDAELYYDWHKHKDESLDWLRDQVRTEFGDERLKHITAGVTYEVDTESIEDWEKYYDELHGLFMEQDHTRETFQWHAVSWTLQHYAEEICEVFADINGCTLWARTSGGQECWMDLEPALIKMLWEGHDPCVP